MNIKLILKKNMFSPKFYPLLFDYSHRWEVYMGSAGSSKSYFITQKIICRCCREQRKVLVSRRYGTTLRNSCFSLFKEILTKWKIIDQCRVNNTNLTIGFPNGSEIIFLGLDDETKLLSLAGISDVFIEEVFEVPKEIVEQLNLRLRGTAKDKQIFMAFNPINKSSWLYEFCNNLPEDAIYIHSTYKDNPFLDDAYIKQLDSMITSNPAKARVFCFGEWGVNPEGLVFSNWSTDFIDIKDVNKFEHRCGADLGWTDPTTIVESYYDRKNKIIYVVKEFYRRKCQLSDVAEQIRFMGLESTKIFFDSAEPRTIDFFKKEGFRAIPCVKGHNSVKARIMFLQDHKIIIDKTCVNLINEFENFSYIQSKETGAYTEDTTHEFSHAIDGLGYAYSDIYTKGKLRTLDKSILGL